MTNSYRVFTDQHYAYFITWTVVNWLPLFDQAPYRKIILDALNYLRTNKSTQLNAFVIMPTHLHAILWPEIGISLSDVTRDFKRFTSREISKEAKCQGNTNFLEVFKKPETIIARKMFPFIRSGKRDRTLKQSSQKNLGARKWTTFI